MNKIKGKVICKIAEILSEMDVTNPDEGIKVIKQILAIKEIAMVDRAISVNLPDLPPNPNNPDKYSDDFATGYILAQGDMVKKGWRMEVTDG